MSAEHTLAVMNSLMMDHFPLTLTTVAERAERLHGAREIVTRRPDRQVERSTYRTVLGRSRCLAAGLRDLGIAPADRVATLLWNQSEHLELYFAVPGIGAVIHTLNPRLHPHELAYIVRHAEDRAIVVDETLLPVLDSFRADSSIEHVIVVSHADPAPAGMLEYEGLLDGRPPIEWPVLDERSAAAMCYTSGTTGQPKGVVYSHRSALLHALGACLPDALGVCSADTILPVVPMFHANAWGLPYAAALCGSKLVLPGPRLDAESVLELLAEEHVTMTAGVPTVWMAMLTALDAEPRRWDLGSLRALIVGGAAVPESMLRGFDAHGLRVVQAWGMTETSPLGTVCHPLGGRTPSGAAGADDGYAYRARQGIPVPLVEVRARDDAGQEVAWDDEALGELEVRGPWIAAGYHGGDGTQNFTADGWFQTGDIVTIDSRGCIRIRDRAKDLVKSGGEWISSVEMENLLMAHPTIAEAAVIAVPDERWGERPLAAVVFGSGHRPTDAELREHLAAHFAKWQLPERFEVLDELPRTATGKWKKTELRERLADPPPIPRAPAHETPLRRANATARES